MEHSSLQRELLLLVRMEGPSVVPPEFMRHAKTYRDVVRLAWQLRRVRNLTYRGLAEQAGLTYQHVGDYFNSDDKPTRRDLPGQKVRQTEAVLGNTAISQWHARNALLTVVEEMQCKRMTA